MYEGYTTQWLVECFPEATITVVDPWMAQKKDAKMYRQNNATDWEDIYERFCARFDGKCTVVRTDSITASYMMQEESFDLIFIDADHSYKAVKDDIRHWLPKMRKGGLLCGHDYSNRKANAGVIKAVNEMIGEDNIVVGARKTWIHLVE